MDICMNIREINNDDAPDIVFCGKAETILLPGGKGYQCSQCGERCACSAEGQKYIETGAKPVCFKCGLALYNLHLENVEFVYSGQSLRQTIEKKMKMKDN